ncbi:MAG: response regulator [Rhizomicrobium sp.]
MRDYKSVFGGSLLLVEDDPINADIACRMLQKMGMHVHMAVGGDHAIACWQREEFGLVLMDCEMPGKDGFETTRQIRELERRKASHTPVVALTAHAAADVRGKCLSAGMDDLLEKPVRDAQMAALLRRWMPDSALDGASGMDNLAAARMHGSIDCAALDQVAAFRGPGGRSLLQTLAARFAQNSLKQVREMQRTGASGEIRRIAHTLKSSSAALGALRVSKCCAQIETHAGEPARLAGFLPALENELASAVKSLLELTQDKGGPVHG